MDTLRAQGFTEIFFRDCLAVIKLRLNSASSASHCRGITSLINAPKKRRIFDLRSYFLHIYALPFSKFNLSENSN
jgi:hypothetical protein